MNVTVCFVQSATQLEHHSVASLNEAVLLWQVMPNCQLTEEKLKLVEQCVPKVCCNFDIFVDFNNIFSCSFLPMLGMFFVVECIYHGQSIQK